MVDNLIWFGIGIFIGALIGVIIMVLCVASGRSDDNERTT